MHLLNEALSLDRVPSTSLPVKVGQAPQCDHSLEYLTVVQHQTPPPPPLPLSPVIWTTGDGYQRRGRGISMSNMSFLTMTYRVRQVQRWMQM